MMKLISWLRHLGRGLLARAADEGLQDPSPSEENWRQSMIPPFPSC
jgi:hypothetical protein